MVSGGVGEAGWKEQDPWRHGLNVFDLSALAWSDGYATDKQYETPQVIRDWYDQGYVTGFSGCWNEEELLILTQNRGLDSVNWTNDDVRAMFVNGEYCLASSNLATGDN